MSRWLRGPWVPCGIKARGVEAHPGVALGAGGSLLVARRCRRAVVGPHSCSCSLHTFQLRVDLSPARDAVGAAPLGGQVEGNRLESVFLLRAQIHVVMDLSVVLASQKTWESSSVWVSKDQHFWQQTQETHCHLCHMLLLTWGDHLQHLQIMHTVYWFFFSLGTFDMSTITVLVYLITTDDCKEFLKH